MSWLLIFFLVLWTLTANLFPLNYPGLSGGTYLLMGISGTLLFFTSILIHELSHSFVARTKGIPVEGITLFAFGGVSQTRMDAETPGDEFQIAGVGPLTSLVLAGIAGLVWYFGRSAGLSIAIVGVAGYLAGINVLLAVFNLLPGFPLDGGRLFRSIVWRLTDNLKRATRVASIGGRILGYGLILLGFLQLFSPTPNYIGGLWFILIGWFLNNAAQSSYQELVVRMMLEGSRVQDVMTYNPETVSSDLKLQELVDQYLFNRNYQSFPVESEGHPVGLVTLGQVKQTPREEWQQRTVSDVMIPVAEGITVSPNQDMSSVLEQMQESRSRRLLVTTNGHLDGILSVSDIANWLQRQRTFGGAVSQREQTLPGQVDERLQAAGEQG
ncbi:MAG: site-2 protease family protein [Elainellaceae cyanobacterium]